MRVFGFVIVSAFAFLGSEKTYGEASTKNVAETLVFTQTETPTTNVTWRGQTLIEKDTINYLEPKTFADSGKVQMKAVGDWQVVNTISDAQELQYRKEVGIRPDRVELTVQMNLPAYKNVPEKTKLTYSFMVPCKLLAGMKWKAVVGSSHATSTKEGELTEKTPDGDLVGTRARWIAFEGGGRHIVFDLNPKGLASYWVGSNDVAVLWEVRKSEGYLRFTFEGKGQLWGGVYTGKAVIFEGTADDYLNHHSGNLFHYYWILPVKHNFTFGSATPGKDYTAVDESIYDPTKNFGWETGEGLEKIGDPSGSLGYNALASAKDNTFVCNLTQPGLYIVRVLAGNPSETDRGAFSVYSNEELKAENVTVPKGKLKDITYSQWLPAGPFKLKFSGSWMVSGVSLQMLIHKEEDYAFNRGVWLAEDVYEPTPIVSSAFYRKPVSYKVAVSEMDLPSKEVVEPAKMPAMPEKKVALPDQKNPKLAWRYDGFIGGMGQDNNGTFLEFDTPEKITRRLKEIKADGVNVVLLNGLLARHLYRNHLPRIQKTVSQIVRIAHELDIRVLDHVDLTLLLNQDTGMRTMVENIDWCQRTIDNDTIIQGWCPINPDLRKAWFAEMKQYVDDTGIDGIMVDEVSYHDIRSCGCPHCRAQFTRETGLVFPWGENASLINDGASKIRKAWLQWRLKAVGDWWIAFRNEVLADRPDFCIMGYMSEYGVQSDYASINYAYDLFEMARSNDFVGTEIMSRNVMDNFRYVFSTRRMYNIFRQEYGSPVFGLIYHIGNEYFSYFGWAMNNMLGQATWDINPVTQRTDTPNFLQWRENMDKRLAVQLADVAIVFSVKSRDYSSSFGGPGRDALGISQILTDNHIQHVFLSDLSLQDDAKLKNYRLVILPGDCCMSDREIQVVRDYVNQGGQVLATGYTGLSDEYGMPRSRWGLAELLKCEVSAGDTYPAETKLATTEGDLSASYSSAILKITDPKQSKILLNAVASDGKVLGPACVSQNMGKGSITYSAAQPGVANYQPPFDNDEQWQYERNSSLAEVLRWIVRQAAGSAPLRFEPVRMPAPLLSTVWMEELDGRRRTLVHLLNATGVRIKKGEKVLSEKTQPAFPVLESDPVFEIELPSFTAAYATSPDFQGHKTIAVEKISSTRYRVTVPREAIKAYTLVVLE
jgi:hypothetical protein